MRVKLSKAMAKWYLDNPESFAIPSSGILLGYDVPAQMSMATLMGVDIWGDLKHQGAEPGTYYVEWYTPFGLASAYYQFKMEIVV